LLILYLFLRFADAEYVISIIAICSLIFLSTLNRESSALSLAIIALLICQKRGLSKASIIGVGATIACFLIAYIALRYFIIDPKQQRFIFLDAGHLLYTKNLTGIAFWVLFFLLSMALAINKENRLMITTFHVLCLPYIIICFTSGVLWEMRLYMPLFLQSIYLSKIDSAAFTIHLSRLSLRTMFRRPTSTDSLPYKCSNRA